MHILTDTISGKTLMLANLQSDAEIEGWLETQFYPSEVHIPDIIDAVKARDNSALAYYGLRVRQITDLRPRYIPDIDSLTVDLEANGVTVAEESSLADMVSALYHVDPEQAEKYL